MPKEPMTGTIECPSCGKKSLNYTMWTREDKWSISGRCDECGYEKSDVDIPFPTYNPITWIKNWFKKKKGGEK